MKHELDRSKGSFKLDLIETANADPTVSPADLKLLVAYVSVMEWPSCRAWLSPTLARAKTGISERQYWTSKARLSGKRESTRSYMTPVSKGGKVDTFKLINPWRDESRQHVEAMLGYHKAAECQRKEKSRANKSASQTGNLSLTSLQGHKPGCPCRICSPVPAMIADKYPSSSTPSKTSPGEKNMGGDRASYNDNHLSHGAA